MLLLLEADVGELLGLRQIRARDARNLPVPEEGREQVLLLVLDEPERLIALLEEVLIRLHDFRRDKSLGVIPVGGEFVIGDRAGVGGLIEFTSGVLDHLGEDQRANLAFG